MSYTYNNNMDNALQKTTFTNNSYSEISYDGLGRKTKDVVKSSSGSLIAQTAYAYLDKAGTTQTSSMVSGITYSNPNVNNISYTYDSVGNITKITYSNGTYEEYTYDELNRLQKVDYSNGDWELYDYSNTGNITSKATVKSGTSTVISYTYGDSVWKDLLTKYNGKAITYDTLGNPLTYDGKTFTWIGRKNSLQNKKHPDNPLRFIGIFLAPPTGIEPVTNP